MTSGHALLMDRVYARQKHIYDATRKYYLFGRDRLIAAMAARPGQRVLELGCGTGRNLAQIARAWPGVQLHGIDISRAMLDTAAARVPAGTALAQADASRFDPAALFGSDRFDHVVISYALSMIPDWTGTLEQAVRCLDCGGSLHVVDFGDLAGLPRPLGWLLRGWLRRFHVSIRADLGDVATALARRHSLDAKITDGPGHYYRLVTLHRPV